jgi:hypothetical protein
MKHRDAASKAGFDLSLSQQIDHYLLRAMVMLIVSRAETLLEDMFCKKAELTGHEEYRSFMSSVIDKSFRTPEISKIVGNLNKLSKVRGIRLSSELDKRPEMKAHWDSLLTARHAIVHRANSGSVNMDWYDLKKYYESYLEILSLVSISLDLSKKEMDEILLAP